MNLSIRSLALFAAVCLTVRAQESAPTPDGRSIIIRAKTVFTSPTTAIHDASILIVRGEIISIVASKSGGLAENPSYREGFASDLKTANAVNVPADIEVLDVPQGTVTAGLVLAHYRPPEPAPDPMEAVTPNAFGADLLDPFEPIPALSRGGITVANVSPGYERLVSGQGSAVRIGVSPEKFVLKRSSALRVNIGEGPRRTPDLFRPPILPGPDDPLPAAVPQAPKTRAGALAELRSLFGKAAEALARAPDETAASDANLLPFIAVLQRRVPLRVAADRYADIARAIDLAREFKIPLVIEGGNEAWRLADRLKEIDADVVLRASFLAPVGSTPEAPIFRAAGEGSPDAPGVLRAAGVRIALIPPSDADPGNLLFYAARAIGPQFSATDALAAVTENAARILKLDQHEAGVIATGRPADLAVWPGGLADAAAKPLLVMASGRITHRAKLRDDLIAITAGRVHTCAGDAIDNCTVVVEKGKIRAIGQRVTIPADARRIEDKTAVIVPGFIDGGTQVGLRGYQVTSEEAIEMLPPLGPMGMEQNLLKYFDADLPAVAATAHAGVTAVALSPGGGRLNSGVIAVVKTAGLPKEREVRRVGGVLFDLSTSPPNEATRKALDGMLEAGKKYADSFTEYEKKLEEWKKGQKPSATPREKVEAVTAPKPRDPISGTWEGRIVIRIVPRPIDFTLQMKLDGTTVSGTVSTKFPRELETKFEGRFEDGKLTASIDAEGMQAEIEATVARDTLNGTVKFAGAGEGTIHATRTAALGAAPVDKPGEEKKEPSAAEAADDGRPKAPKTQEGLEPWRELFADRGSVFVACPNELVTELALALFRTKYELRTVMISTAEIQALAPKLAQAAVALAPSPSSIREEDGVLINPAAIAVQHKIPVLFRSGWEGDPRALYLTGEMAVRDGVDPEDALRMVTRQPARFLGVLDRMGTLERGKDADLVLLTGEPFSPGTRVKRVMINGRFVDEERKP